METVIDGVSYTPHQLLKLAFDRLGIQYAEQTNELHISFDGNPYVNYERVTQEAVFAFNEDGTLDELELSAGC